MRRKYPAYLSGFLKEHYADHTTAELLDMVRDAFGIEMTKGQMQAYGKNHKLRKSPETLSRRNHNPRYSDEWREWFRDYVPGHEEREIDAECRRVWGFGMTQGMIGNWKVTLGVKSGTHGGRFGKGHEPYNKGRPLHEWASKEVREKMTATQYAIGNVPMNRREVGETRMDKDGYTYIKVRDGSKNANWKQLHRVVWEEANGPVPDGCVVVFLDGDKTNAAIENLGLETMAQHGIISVHGLDYWDGESHETARLMAELMHRRSVVMKKKRAARIGGSSSISKTGCCSRPPISQAAPGACRRSA